MWWFLFKLSSTRYTDVPERSVQLLSLSKQLGEPIAIVKNYNKFGLVKNSQAFLLLYTSDTIELNEWATNCMPAKFSLGWYWPSDMRRQLFHGWRPCFTKWACWGVSQGWWWWWWQGVFSVFGLSCAASSAVREAFNCYFSAVFC